VQIIREGHKRVCVGSIKVYNKKLQKALVSPSDNRIPRIVVKLTDLPSDFCKNHIKYENTLFACRLCEWAENSPFPNGEIICVVGEAGEIEPETMRILIEQDIDYEEFSSALLQCLPSCDSWTIPHEEIVNRRDFRSECVLTIDPSTARDLDDALHLKLISPSIYEVGVHIADVSYFLLPDSPLDKIASQRATSIYLVQRVIPMLPRPLCEYLCSLIPNKDRLTFSVVWTLSDKGEVISMNNNYYEQK
jgi:DIS3-like exonuclease 2